MLLVIDSNVLISAAIFKGSIPDRLFRIAMQNHTILFSAFTYIELIKTLNRPKLTKYISRRKREAFLVQVKRFATFVSPLETITVCRDPKDNKFLELALSGKADCIISGDEDLLILNPFRGIPILTANEFLDRY
jgi:hypothetical protein